MTTVTGATSTNTQQTPTAKVGKQLDQNYSDFLHLLTTQLQNQDPTAPADTNQLTQQIATLSQVEQQIDTNNSLKELIALFSANQTFSNVSYIGKQVETKGNQGILDNGQAAFVYNLPDGAESVQLDIFNSANELVYSGDGTTLAGRNQVIWNGKNGSDQDMPEGIYTISVAAKDAAGKPMSGATTRTTGIVKAVDTQNGTSTLSLGDFSVAINDVLSVRTPGI